MNNKGFSLVELLVVLSLIAIIIVIVLKVSSNTLSLSDKEAYEITKSNIIKATDKYLLECENNILECNYTWNNNKTTFKANNLIEAGYFNNLINPINNKDLKDCLIINVENVNNEYKITLNDNNCK